VKFRSKTFITIIILTIVYAAVNLLAAPPKSTLQRYHINASQLRLINTTVVVPVVAIWFTAVYGSTKLRRYAYVVRNSPQGKQIWDVSKGVAVLAWWLPISSTLSALFSLFARSHPALLGAVTIFTNYLSLLFPLIGFWILSKACMSMSKDAKLPMRQGGLHWLIIAVITGGVFFSYLVARGEDTIHSVYHMSVPLVLLTLVIPFIFSWYLGLLAIYDLHRYTLTVKGLIYRKSWNTLVFGIGWIILFSIVLQYLTAVSAKLGSVSLSWILTLVYGIIVLMGLGYVFIARGAKKLAQIEEV
jgi:hypothetical protein